MIHTAPVLPGETLAGKYRVDRVLGEGGMGVVVGARHVDLDERVAIKFLLGDPSEEAVARFLREARAAAKVKGEHVCRVFDFGRLETGEPYIVMEHLEGIDLAKKLAREGPPPIPLVVGWMIEICDAIAEAHALGIIHRDLKPANVFLATRADGATSAKVLDFGISKLPSQQMTRTTARMGSPAYMSPEQMESARDVDARADVWSLGAMLYELLSGRPPFLAESVIQLAVMIREQDPPPLAGVPEGLARVVARCLAKKPDDRYPSVAALAVDLGPFAPPDALGIVARLERQVTPRDAGAPASRPADAATERPSPETRAELESSDTEMAPSAPPASSEDREPPSAAREEDGEAALLGRIRGTFSPVQSTTPEATTPRRRWSSIVVALGALAVIGGTARSVMRDEARGAAPAPAPPPSSVVLVDAASPDPPPAVVASVTASAAPAPPPVSVSTAPRPRRPAVAPTAAPATTVREPSTPAATSAPSPTVATSASAATSAPAPSATPAATTVAGPRRRTLDREDP